MANKQDKDKKVDTMQDDLADFMAEKNHPKRKRLLFSGRSQDIQRDLVDVYTDGNGKIPDLTKMERSQRPLWKTIVYVLIAVFAVLLVAAASGFFIFNNLNKKVFTNESVIFKIQPPVSIVSGQTTSFDIIVTNQEKVNLYNAKIEIVYPDNFQYASSDPITLNDQHNQWEFSLLKPGETEKITLTGKIVAPLGSVDTFKGTLTFKPENLNANFSQDAVADATVNSSLINLNVTGPDHALANQPVEYDISYQNTSDQEYDNLQLVVDYPTGFVFGSSDVAPTDGNNNVWAIDKLGASSSSKLVIKGSYSAVQAGGNQEFKARIQLKQNDDWYPQAQNSVITNVIKDQLSLQMIVNGSGTDQPISFGDLMVYSLSYKNTGQDDLKNIKIVTEMNSDILDFNSVSNENKGVVGTSTITWTGKQIPLLLKLGAGQEGTINWTVKVKDSSVVNDSKISNFSVQSFATADAQQGTSTLTNSEVKTTPITNTINSDLGIKAEARYYNEDDIAVGSGPIGPKSGEQSTYEIKLSLSNNLHDINDLMAVATLPKNVTWANSSDQSVGNLTYSAKSNKVTWTISHLVKSANDTQATFKVSINPTDADVGKILILVSGVNLTAKDGTTGADISKDLKAVTTAFDDPTLGQQNGIVQ